VRSDDFEQDVFFRLQDLGEAHRGVQVGSVLRGRVSQSAQGPRLTDITVIRKHKTSPYLVFSVLCLIVTAGLTCAVWMNFHVSILVAYLMGLNVSALFFMGLDKSLARSGALRTPEAIMFVFAVLGGSPGVLLGIHMFRHKTRKALFQFVLFLIFLAQFAVLRALGIELRPS